VTRVDMLGLGNKSGGGGEQKTLEELEAQGFSTDRGGVCKLRGVVHEWGALEGGVKLGPLGDGGG